MNSRHYDPEVGRFISADTTDILGADSDLYDKNLYAYCDNNPVMRADSDGELWILAAGAISGVVAIYTSNVIMGVLFNDETLLDAMKIGTADIPGLLGGAISGMLSVTGMSVVGFAVSNAVINATTYLAECGYSKQKVKAAELVVSVGVGAIMDGSSKPFNGNRVRGVIETANRYIANSSSVKKKTMYVAKKTAARSSVVKNGVSSVGSTIFGTGLSQLVLKVGQWFASKFKL